MTTVVNDLTIKKAQREDMDTIAKFIRSSAEWYEPFLDEKDLGEHYVDEEWKKENFHRRDFYLGHHNKHGEVGTISLQYFGDYAYLGYLYLDSEHTGKGFGKAFMDFATEKCRSKDMKGICLIAHPEAKWAVKAYEKYGFEKKAENREEILQWNNGFLEPYYEEGFHLYVYDLTQ